MEHNSQSRPSTIPNLPSRQKAQVYTSCGGAIEYKEIDVPQPKSTELLVKVLYSGVCHTDLHVWKGELEVKAEFPLIGGHEGVGTVAAMGSHVSNFQLEEMVGIKFINSSCLNCEMCKKGFEPNCVDSRITGLTVNGTFAQYALVNATEAVRIPEACDLSSVAPMLCAGLTVYKALKESQVRPGEIVAINGACGGLGTLAIQFAKAMGMRVVAIDMGDKEEFAKKLGAEFYVDGSVGDEKKFIASIIELTSGGSHGVINIATSEKAIQLATEYVRTRGTVVLVALPKDAQIKASVFWTVFKAITIKGSYVGSRLDMDEAIGFFARGLIHAPVQIRPLSELPAIFEQMKKGEVRGRIVVDMSK